MGDAFKALAGEDLIGFILPVLMLPVAIIPVSLPAPQASKKNINMLDSSTVAVHELELALGREILEDLSESRDVKGLRWAALLKSLKYILLERLQAEIH
ncbi:hypothetical protein BDV23DRAFT_189459 [Aspergillus alliaceus]|uniref:Uncharacterized protein n=1 Tax=Petromyces alliaceus TaxID=209559 RepID=A0A5N7BRN9_PETAA|nr:hypothetical protein BDV23DRAFT_189459 [Aspergillus alliaceus]